MADDERIIDVQALTAPTALPGNRLSLAPLNFEFTGTDRLRLTVHNSQVGAVVAVHYRMRTPLATSHANAFTLAPTSDRAATTAEASIGIGALQNVAVFALSGSPRRGQTYVRLQVIRGDGAAATVLGTIVQGYVTGQQDLSWPGSPIAGSTEGDGFIRTIVGTDPGVGTNIAETVPTGARWELLGCYARLACDATAAVRRPILQFIAGAFPVTRSPHPGTLNASQAADFTWGQGMAIDTVISAGGHVAGLPIGLRLIAGQIIATATDGIQAGDDYDAPVLQVQEWLEAN